ncbi:MAG: hypothetical protein U0Z26_18860, partial [Anaerolineales bacterium]
MPLHSPTHHKRIFTALKNSRLFTHKKTLQTFLALTLATFLLIGCTQPTNQTPAPNASPEPILPQATNTPEPVKFNGQNNGTIFLSIEENGYAHLFLIQPQ